MGSCKSSCSGGVVEAGAGNCVASIVYIALATLLETPLMTAIALTVCVKNTFMGLTYKGELVLGVVPSTVTWIFAAAGASSSI